MVTLATLYVENDWMYPPFFCTETIVGPWTTIYDKMNYFDRNRFSLYLARGTLAYQIIHLSINLNPPLK